jgi:iron complex outermembrane receptor protein
VLAFLLLAATALAQEKAPDPGEASLEQLGQIEVYSASKHAQSTSDAPASVTVITADEIQSYGYRTLADILRSVSGFYVTYDRNYAFVGVRGFGRLGDWNSRILLLVDGHRLNNNVFGQAMLGSEFPVDVDLIERVEIVRGPSSSLYGTDAFLAVISVVTRKGQQLKGWELSFEPRSFDSYKGRASYGGSYRGVGWTLSGTVYESAGQTLFYPAFTSPATNNGTTSHTDDETYAHVLATVGYRGFTLQGMFSTREKGTPTAYFGTLFNDPRTRNFDDHQYFGLSYQHSFDGKWELTAHTSYDQQRLEAPLAYGAGSKAIGVDKFSDRGNWWTGEVKLSRTFLEKHILTLGSEVRDNIRQDQGDYTSATGVFTQDLNSSSVWAFYAQDEFGITQNLKLNAGIRYDHYSTFGGTANPRLALIYRPYEPTTVKLLYGSAFRAPDVFEIFPGFSFYEDNSRLKPEVIHSGEWVVEQGLGRHFKVAGSVYRNQIDHLISLETNSGDGKLQYQNTGQAQATGTDIDFLAHSAYGLQGRASFSYVDADEDVSAHRKLNNSPRHMAKADITMPFFQKRLVAGLEGQYFGSRLTLAGNTVGGFQVFNLTLLGHTLGKHLDLSTSVYNVLDRRYSDPGRPEDPEDAIRQDGRSFRVKITGRF